MKTIIIVFKDLSIMYSSEIKCRPMEDGTSSITVKNHLVLKLVLLVLITIFDGFYLN